MATIRCYIELCSGCIASGIGNLFRFHQLTVASQYLLSLHHNADAVS